VLHTLGRVRCSRQEYDGRSVIPVSIPTGRARDELEISAKRTVPGATAQNQTDISTQTKQNQSNTVRPQSNQTMPGHTGPKEKTKRKRRIESRPITSICDLDTSTRYGTWYIQVTVTAMQRTYFLCNQGHYTLQLEALRELSWQLSVSYTGSQTTADVGR